MKKFWVLTLLLVSGIACDSATEGPGGTEDPGTVSGIVREEFSQDPLPDITVKLSSFTTTTDQDGRFEFRDVPAGSRTLVISTPRFELYSTRLDVLAGSNSHDILLARIRYYEFSAGQENDFGIFLTPGVSTYRGLIFLVPAAEFDTRGFASAIPRTGPPHTSEVNQIIAAERQHSLPLAEKYGMALMGADVSGFGSSTISLALTALEEFADASGHPELVRAPLFVMGFSFGGCYAHAFTHEHPDRVIGFMSQKGGCHQQLIGGEILQVPGYLVIGEDDTESRSDNIKQLFDSNRAEGALWALAVEPGSAHVPVQDQELLSNWMDAVIGSRLPETVMPGEPVRLNAVSESSGWLGNLESFSTAAYPCYDEDRLLASWLPSMQTAMDWQRFVSSASVTTVTPCGG